MRRKLLSILLAGTMIFAVGCNSPSKKTDVTPSEEPVVSQAASAEPVTQVSEEPEEEPLLVNGDFEMPNKDPDAWKVFTQGGIGTFAVEDGTGILDISDTGTVNYGVQLYQDIGELTQGCKYKVSFDVSATAPRTIEYCIQINGGDYHPYSERKEISVTTDVQTETQEFEMKEASDPAPRLVFNCGVYPDTEGLESHQIFFDNVTIEMTDDSGKVVVEPVEVKVNDININQIGYEPSDKKTAVFRGDNMDSKFDVVNTETNEVVYTGDITGEKSNMTAEEIDYYGDFSDVKDAGTYVIRTANHGDSYEFKIEEGVYKNCYEDVVRMLYLQRCGCETSSDIAGKFAHKACHMDKATIYGTKKKIDVSGGWHDAGDYGRYVVAGAKAVYDLLLAVEQGNDALSDSLGIPESNNKIPDLLDEVRYELEWMLKMQDSKSGGVYHKVTCAAFPGDDVLPENETEELIVSPISTTATYDFAAVMAKASTMYKEYDAAFAKKCLAAAKKAMKYAEKNGPDGGFKNPEGIGTGAYDDTVSRDERYWACAELFSITGDKEYLETFKAIAKNDTPTGFGWQSVGSYGTYAYLRSDKKEEGEFTDGLFKKFIDEANSFVAKSANDGYHISLGSDYVWGSNLNVASNAMLMILANNLQPNENYLYYAKEHLNYCLGVNPMSISYVTGYGTTSPMNVHHRPSYAIGESMKGMLVGGPNKNFGDPYAQAVCKDAPPAKCYVDHHASFSTNEVTIYWNSPLIFLMSQVK